ncbi:VWA domain-containing protein [Mycobacterium sp.]|uniref:VWA domain-containing protein n=1 Tax=Mycobacterium sp. TaxID=1785 RepID=UPI002CFBA345|nr:VWA domain-containing protein [Mycobacterium sp.]HME49613.1 VWA domain-containing protein [Mycobacterium sp.]
MTMPGLGVMSLSGFDQPWWFLLALVPVGLIASYMVMQAGRSRRVRRFTSPDLLDSVAPERPTAWRHLPVTLLTAALLLLTVALAGPTHELRQPRNRAVIMLAIDVSQSMRADDVSPSRLAAAQQAAERFADQVTPGVNLGLVAFAGTANLLVSPTPNHASTTTALHNLRPADSTATGEAIFTALQSIATVKAVISSDNDKPPPARIVLLSDGKENKPESPDNPRGCYTAARTARDQGVPISTISFGTQGGIVAVKDQQLPVPVDGEMMTNIAKLSGGQSYTAANIDELNRSYGAVQQQVGYKIVRGPASAGWLRLAVLIATAAAFLAIPLNRRLPI